MRRISLFLLFMLAAGALRAAEKPAITVQLPPKPLLPMSFAGWTATVGPTEATHPVSPTIGEEGAAFLQELGFRRESIAGYTNGSAKIDIDAAQFADATSAYSFFTDHQGDSFRNGDTVVLVNIESGAPAHLHQDLQVLAKTLPIPFGTRGQLPTLPDYLPKNGLDKDNLVYAFGPQVFGLYQGRTKSPLAGKLDFNTGAEVIVGQYGSGNLTLVEYPTPQMAIAQLKSIATMLQLAPQKDLPEGLLGNSSEVAWRAGPLVALTSGMPQAQAVKLAHELHYESEIIWDKPQGYVSDAYRAARLYLNIFALAGILCAASVILGLFFGGARAISRVLRGKPASAVQDTEFISLDLGHGGDYRKDRKD